MCNLWKTCKAHGYMGKSLLICNMIISLPTNVNKIIDTLYNAGYEAYAVGGCIRDSILSKNPYDWDITTNARPEEVKKLFPKTLDTGIKHGTVSILFKENNQFKSYEVTTYRCDGLYSDGRHPDDVTFVNNLHEDLARRDFTINAIAYNEKAGIVDDFSGISDLENKIVRAVGDPLSRFKEDALRMMRAIRFSAQLSFEIDKKTYDAIITLAENLSHVSKERIAVELIKVLLSDNPENVYLFFDTKLSKYITDDFDKVNKEKLFRCDKKHIALFSLLFSNEDIAKKILLDLKLDMDTINKVSKLIEEKSKVQQSNIKINEYFLDQKTIKSLIFNLGFELAKEFLRVLAFKYNVNFNDIIEKINSYEKNATPIFLKDLAVNGDWFKDFGYSGPDIGYAMNFVLSKIWENEKLNNKEDIKLILNEMKVSKE